MVPTHPESLFAGSRIAAVTGFWGICVASRPSDLKWTLFLPITLLGATRLMEGAGTVIMLTRLNGEQFALNCDLIERIEESPDTVLTLVDGKHIMVAERLSEIIDAIRLDRAAVLAIAQDVANAVDSPAGPAGPNVISMNPRR